ncbi:hypothetical protein [Bacillus phage PK2]|nr:hypothetical protein [Bacillus phage PK2]
MVSIQNADTYFQTEVLLNDAWVNADQDMKSRALKNAENMIYRYFKRFNKETKPVPDVAVFEQAYFILLIDETIQKSALGVKQVSVSGISISVDAPQYPISPEVRMILGGNVRVGRSRL